MYDLTTGRLQQRPVPRVYPQLNVFKDIRNSTDTEIVQFKFKLLEDEAAGIVRAIHDGSQSGKVKLSRGRLSTLRKFIFLTNLRWLAVNFQEAGVEKRGKNPLLDAWLEGLKYYLDTPHYRIIATGERIRERYGNSLFDMLRDRSYPESERLAFEYAVEYEVIANNYALGIWVAAEGSEFVLGGRAFTHNEGLIDFFPAHVLCVLTPRIAIILRRTCLLDPTFNNRFLLHSALADVQITPPITRCAREDLIDILEADPQALLLYRATPAAEQDSFTYVFTQLSPKDTYAVNEVTLMSAALRYRGSVIFRQPSVMRETLDRYQASPNVGKQKSFRPLLEQLRDLESQGDS